MSRRVSLKRGHGSLDPEGEKEPCKELGKKLPGGRVSKSRSPEEGVRKATWWAQPISLQGAETQGWEVPSLLQGMRAGDRGQSPVPQAARFWVQPQACQGLSPLVRGTERQGTTLESWRGAGRGRQQDRRVRRGERRVAAARVGVQPASRALQGPTVERRADTLMKNE